MISVDFIPDSKRLASGSKDSTIIIWDIGTAKLNLHLKEFRLVNSAAFSPDGKILACESEDGSIKLLNMDKKC